MALINQDWFQVDDRCWDRPGAVYDLGCLAWDWSRPYLGRIPVVGVDPQETTCPEGAVLVQAVVAPFSGKCRLYGGGLGANTHQVSNVSIETTAITWQDLVRLHGPANILKMNIEGGEIPLLMSMRHPVADQICCAFHDWQDDETLPPKEATRAVIDYLAGFYTVIETFPKLRWFLFLKKEGL